MLLSHSNWSRLLGRDSRLRPLEHPRPAHRLLSPCSLSAYLLPISTQPAPPWHHTYHVLLNMHAWVCLATSPSPSFLVARQHSCSSVRERQVYEDTSASTSTTLAPLQLRHSQGSTGPFLLEGKNKKRHHSHPIILSNASTNPVSSYLTTLLLPSPSILPLTLTHLIPSPPSSSTSTLGIPSSPVSAPSR